MEMIALHQIVTRGKGIKERVIIPPNSRFDTADYPDVSAKEWDAMLKGTPQIIRTPDDPAFVKPQVVSNEHARPIPRQEEEEEEEVEEVKPTPRARGRRPAKDDDDDL